MDLLTKFHNLISDAPLDSTSADYKAFRQRAKEFEEKLADLIIEYNRYLAEEYDAQQDIT